MDKWQRLDRAAELQAAIANMTGRLGSAYFKSGSALSRNDIDGYERWDRAASRRTRAMLRLARALGNLADGR